MKQNNGKIWRSVVWLLPILFLQSCASVYYMDFMVPSSSYIPARVRKIATINRSAPPARYTTVRGAPYLREDLQGLDYSSAEYTFRELQNIDTTLQRYQWVSGTYLDHKRSEFQWAADTLSYKVIDSLCAVYNVDALLSADAYESDIIGSRQVEMTNDLYAMAYNDYTVSTQSLWRMYDCNLHKVGFQKRIDFTETLPDINFDSTTVGSTKATKAAFLVSKDIAESLYNELAPHWQTDSRMVYETGSPDMDSAAVALVVNNNVDKAILFWRKAIESKEKRVQRWAYYNMAFACELRGQPKLGIDWLDEAKSKGLENHAIRTYRALLQRQVIALKVVQEQLGY